MSKVFQTLNFKEYPFRIREGGNGKFEIFDEVRKKYITLTPEEWVRQHFLKFLVTDKNVPVSLVSVEKKLVLNQMDKRADIVVYSKDAKPLLIVECKAPEIKIDQKTFDQVVRYNMVLKVKYICVTNGLEHYFCKMDYETMNYSFLKELPGYKEMK